MSSPAECGAFVIDRVRCLSPDVMLLVQEALVELGNSGTVPGEGEQRQQWAARSDAAAAHHHPSSHLRSERHHCIRTCIGDLEIKLITTLPRT